MLLLVPHASHSTWSYDTRAVWERLSWAGVFDAGVDMPEFKSRHCLEGNKNRDNKKLR
jgi:hypothetical protein